MSRSYWWKWFLGLYIHNCYWRISAAFCSYFVHHQKVVSSQLNWKGAALATKKIIYISSPPSFLNIYSFFSITHFLLHHSASTIPLPPFLFHHSSSIIPLPPFLVHHSSSTIHLPPFLFSCHLPPCHFHLSSSIIPLPPFLLHISSCTILLPPFLFHYYYSTFPLPHCLFCSGYENWHEYSNKSTRLYVQ